MQGKEQKSLRDTPKSGLGPGNSTLPKLAASANQQDAGGARSSPGVPPPPRLIAAPTPGSKPKSSPMQVLGVQPGSPAVNGNQAGYIPPVAVPQVPSIPSVSPPPAQPASSAGTPGTAVAAASSAGQPDQPLTTTKVSLPPNMNPNQISGQLLSLPHSVTHKLDLSKALSLKVNNQRFVVPPSCFISTAEGIKVFLPSGSLPQTMSQGPSKPLEFSISKPDGSSSSQTMKVSEVDKGCKDRGEILSSEDKSIHRRFCMQSTAPNPALCHIHTLHAGFEALLAIFGYLSLPDILR